MVGFLNRLNRTAVDPPSPPASLAPMSVPFPLQIIHEAFTFTWDLPADRARVTAQDGEVWQGSLLPLFWLADHTGKLQACQAVVVPEKSAITDASGELALKLPGFGTAQLGYEFDTDRGGLHFTSLTVQWDTA
jgi:hypothetical protein